MRKDFEQKEQRGQSGNDDYLNKQCKYIPKNEDENENQFKQEKDQSKKNKDKQGNKQRDDNNRNYYRNQNNKFDGYSIPHYNYQNQRKLNNRNNNQQQKNKRNNYSDSDDSLIEEFEKDQYERRQDYKNRQQYHNKQQSHRKNQKKSIFEPYLNEEDIKKGMENHDIFEGIFIQQENQKQLALVKCPLFQRKIQINQISHQNRALHGCLVAVAIIKTIQVDEDTESELSESESEVFIEDTIDPQVIDQIEEDIEANKDWVDVNEDEEQIQKKQKRKEYNKLDNLSKMKIIGKVVKIIKNPYENRNIAGKIMIRQKNIDKQINEEEKLTDIIDVIDFINQQYYLSFIPVNKRLSWINIDKLNSNLFQDLPQEKTVKAFKDYINIRYYISKISGWKLTSNYPTCQLEKEIGLAGNIDVETEVLLTENLIFATEFSNECIQDLQPFKEQCNEKEEYIIPQEEKNIRLDLTKEYICSIDPVTARDLDDALSINEVEKDIFEIGVHIADVSHFVKPESHIDKDAVLRTTSVYLVHKVLPMLPRLLCENLCSLNRDVERLAFSVFFYMRRDGEVLWDRKMKASKSIIRSCAQLSYDVVNQLIKGEIQSFNEAEERYKVAEGFDTKILEEKVKLLNEIGQNRRKKRFGENHAISFEKHKLRFKLDEELKPIAIQEETREQAQFMVEEWMLLANQFVGMKLVEFDRSSAILRNHIPPKAEKIRFFEQLLKESGSDIGKIEVNTSEQLKKLLETIMNDNKITEESKEILKFRLIKLMEAAQYFVVLDTEEKTWHHFALNFSIYTHFTSPIRRYPDILVHRRLFKALQNDLEQTEEDKIKTKTTLKALMQHCNDCKLNARRSSDGSDKIFLCLYLKANPTETDGFISIIKDQYMEIVIPTFNLEKKIEFKKLQNIVKYQVIHLEKYDLKLKQQVQEKVKKILYENQQKEQKKKNKQEQQEQQDDQQEQQEQQEQQDQQEQQEQQNQQDQQEQNNKKSENKLGQANNNNEGALEKLFYSSSNMALVIAYQENEDKQFLRLHILKNQCKVRVRLTGTDTFPLDFNLSILIELSNGNQLLI